MEEKRMIALNYDSLRELVDTVNRLKIQKEDIVALFFGNGLYTIIYYSSIK